ncbi:hypothetical protein SD81_028190 [Tolypothrix campylonemoides VB511288]|nr:hypothetical protein SD81_028190 [Tolypothrix campylonemoides VB511288]
MQALLNNSIIFVVAIFFAFVLFDFIVNVVVLWDSCKPQEIVSQQMQSEPKIEQQQERLPDVWEESQEKVVKRPMQAAPMIFQLALPPAKEAVAVATPTKKRGRPKKTALVTTLATAEASLAATFCQPEQIAVAPAKKRGRPKKSAA